MIPKSTKVARAHATLAAAVRDYLDEHPERRKDDHENDR